MAIDDSNWQEKFEKAFCVKIFNFPYELKGWDIIPPHSTKELYFYKSPKPLGEYIDDQVSISDLCEWSFNSGVKLLYPCVYIYETTLYLCIEMKHVDINYVPVIYILYSML